MLQRKKALLKIPSYAKVNLFLKVLHKREDEYHSIFSFVVKVSLCDILYFRRNLSNDVILSSNSREIPLDEKNSVVKATHLFMKELSIREGVFIHIDKHIPIGSGLGGESSNAAVTLIALNRLFGTKLREKELCYLGEKIGGDVCFFLNGNSAFIHGKGEKLIPTRLWKKLWFVLVLQNFSILSKDAYLMWDTKHKKQSKKHIYIFYNDLDFGHPETEAAKKLLLKEGCISAGVTGSGPTVIGIAPSKEDAETISKRLKGYGLKSLVASTLL